MDDRVRGDDLPTEQVDRPIDTVDESPAGFFDEQGGRSHVPWVQLFFPEPFEPPRRDVAEVERRRPEPAHPLRPVEEVTKARQKAHIEVEDTASVFI